jgi:hypothetical protein
MIAIAATAFEQSPKRGQPKSKQTGRFTAMNNGFAQRIWLPAEQPDSHRHGVRLCRLTGQRSNLTHAPKTAGLQVSLLPQPRRRTLHTTWC